MKILLLTMYDNDGTYYYRQLPLFHLNNIEIEVKRKPYYGDINYSFFEDFTHLFLERPSGTHDLNVIKLAKQVGLKIITDWDDDCLHIDVYNPMWGHYKEAKEIVMECIALSDEVWVSTYSLKKAFSILNSNIIVIPNCLNDYVHKVENKKDFNRNTKKAFWRGGHSHEADVYDVADYILEAINDNEDWQFQFIGCRFIYMELRAGKNYQPVSNMPLMQYFDYLNNESPNIVFHPLQQTRFNESKSNISWIEATYAGAAFFGTVQLPEFSHHFIFPFFSLKDRFEDVESLNVSNQISWDYIKENLLLSSVNKLRAERVLSI